jgi:hypothetical protein
MAWTVRTVFKKPGGDPLYEFFTNYSRTEKNLLKDPSIIGVSMLRNLDRSIGIIFQTWENEESFNQWQLIHSEERSATREEMKSWADENGITFLRQSPSSEDQNWSDPEYMIEGVLGYHRVTLEQIFSGE